ncbi:RnfABCDGE type electron transport complex subunit G [Calditerrivibrio nitroreducens]|uniref:Ion-translocating oxidoreductase complex subunit G n=1 Tax=Calditerrivibrio nitroreducens (strain DSM 19672 / NBRC 101217 / Yu37-1) TaxID=768670 RepID=E4TFN2_CALNY|nr:RnfABCDGE type electron transport complex subunit G [Calditerrivibrio nitroreducens]ADR18500.1 electron transport complex, RnfABCDGE type, G subunit [Calditerrivibrio nitroreducens DSM 19672]
MKNNLSLIYVPAVISAIAAFLLAFTFNGTKEKIEEAYRQEMLKALNVVLPKHNNKPDQEKIELEGKEVYVAKDDGSIVGFAIKSKSSKGYSGDIDILVGIDKSGKVSGIEILKHAETPGLGSKIETDSFKNSFKGLGKSDKIMVKKDGGIIDQFSGATISPRAVCEAVSEAVRFINDKVITDSKIAGGGK